jgi:hypothetical protein
VAGEAIVAMGGPLSGKQALLEIRVLYTAIRRASSPKVLEIKYGRWGFQQE